MELHHSRKTPPEPHLYFLFLLLPCLLLSTADPPSLQPPSEMASHEVSSALNKADDAPPIHDEGIPDRNTPDSEAAGDVIPASDRKTPDSGNVSTDDDDEMDAEAASALADAVVAGLRSSEKNQNCDDEAEEWESRQMLQELFEDLRRQRIEKLAAKDKNWRKTDDDLSETTTMSTLLSSEEEGLAENDANPFVPSYAVDSEHNYTADTEGDDSDDGDCSEVDTEETTLVSDGSLSDVSDNCFLSGYDTAVDGGDPTGLYKPQDEGGSQAVMPAELAEEEARNIKEEVFKTNEIN